VVADCDEDVLAVKEGRGIARVRGLLGAADAITVPTGALAESLSRVNEKAVVAPNGIDLNAWAKVDRFGARKQVRTVGFCGTDSHAANIDLLRPVLAKLSHEFTVQGIRFMCFGIRPIWLAGTVSNTMVTEACSGTEYPAALAKLKIDIALSPLAHTEFNKSRSALKLYEFAAVGAVTIASD
jgi:glycosyltransferase involved in cell wall biosynthesis